ENQRQSGKHPQKPAEAPAVGELGHVGDPLMDVGYRFASAAQEKNRADAGNDVHDCADVGCAAAEERHPPTLSAFSASLRDTLELFLQACKLFIREPLQIDEAQPRALSRAQQLVELELQGARVAVLRVL